MFIGVVSRLDDGDLLVDMDGELCQVDRSYLEMMVYGQVDGEVVEACLTRNCGQRLVCGRLGSVASRMALDDNQATTIDGTHKGAGIIKSQGEVAHIQYYFTEQNSIEKWFTDRGLTRKGFAPGEDPSEAIDPSKLDFGEDEDLSIEHKRTDIDLAGLHREVDFTQNQKFEEV